MAMFLLAAAALATTLPGSQVSARVQATATIRVVRGVVVKLDGSPNAAAPAPRNSVLKSPDGSTQTIKVIEFE